MPQLDGSVFVSGSATYTILIFLVFSMILTGELLLLKYTINLKNFYSFKKLNVLTLLCYFKCY